MKLQIINWKETFENADTRKRQRMGWIMVPTGCDSKGYRRLMRSGKDGAAALGVFIGLCQLMGTMPKETRGAFVNSDGSDMDLNDISEVARIDAAVLSDAIPRLVSCGWVLSDLPVICRSSATPCQQPADLLGTPPNPLISQHNAGSVPPVCQSSAGFVQGEGEGEGKGEGEEEKKSSPPPPKFVEVQAFAKSQMMPIAEECTEAFFDEMEALQWTYKGQPCVSRNAWQARFRKWSTNWHNNATGKGLKR